MNFESAKNKLTEYLEKVKNQNVVRRRKKQNTKNDLSDSLKWPIVRAGLLRLAFKTRFLIGSSEHAFRLVDLNFFFENHFRLFVNELLIDIKVSKIYGKIQ